MMAAFTSSVGHRHTHSRTGSNMLVLITVTIMTTVLQGVRGHGRLMDPPARNSMWRLGFNNPVNYNDNELYCGGRMVQWLRNGGKCGVCGDAYHGPREHEAGGKFANGIVTRSYRQGDVIPITVHLTANHQGWFEVKICPVNDPKTAATQECLDKHVLLRADGGGMRFPVIKGKYNAFFNYTVQLPPDLTCKQCVVQWKYRTGNTWDKDDNSGVFCLGCGPQEEFYNCADIEIVPDKARKTKAQAESGLKSTLTQQADDAPKKDTTPEQKEPEVAKETKIGNEAKKAEVGKPVDAVKVKKEDPIQAMKKTPEDVEKKKGVKEKTNAEQEERLKEEKRQEQKIMSEEKRQEQKIMSEEKRQEQKIMSEERRVAVKGKAANGVSKPKEESYSWHAASPLSWVMAPLQRAPQLPAIATTTTTTTTAARPRSRPNWNRRPMNPYTPPPGATRRPRQPSTFHRKSLGAPATTQRPRTRAPVTAAPRSRPKARVRRPVTAAPRPRPTARVRRPVARTTPRTRAQHTPRRPFTPPPPTTTRRPITRPHPTTSTTTLSPAGTRQPGSTSATSSRRQSGVPTWLVRVSTVSQHGKSSAGTQQNSGRRQKGTVRKHDGSIGKLNSSGKQDSARKTDSTRKPDIARKTDSTRKPDIARKTDSTRKTDSARKTPRVEAYSSSDDIETRRELFRQKLLRHLQRTKHGKNHKNNVTATSYQRRVTKPEDRASKVPSSKAIAVKDTSPKVTTTKVTPTCVTSAKQQEEVSTKSTFRTVPIQSFRSDPPNIGRSHHERSQRLSGAFSRSQQARRAQLAGGAGDSGFQPPVQPLSLGGPVAMGGSGGGQWWHGYRDMVWPSPPRTRSPTLVSELRCRATVTLGGGMDDWCTANCNANYCPAGMCVCEPKQSAALSPPYQLVQQTQTPTSWLRSYQPTVQHSSYRAITPLRVPQEPVRRTPRPVTRSVYSPPPAYNAYGQQDTARNPYVATYSPFAPQRLERRHRQQTGYFMGGITERRQTGYRQGGITERRQTGYRQGGITERRQTGYRQGGITERRQRQQTGLRVGGPTERRQREETGYGVKGVPNWRDPDAVLCRATGRYTGMPQYDTWCRNNCAQAMCPLLMCTCDAF